jgi:hypothetical protein
LEAFLLKVINGEDSSTQTYAPKEIDHRQYPRIPNMLPIPWHFTSHDTTIIRRIDINSPEGGRF